MLFTTLADPTRREVLERLVRGPAAVVDLARAMNVSRPAVSQHLKVLKDAGLVSVTPAANRRIYQVEPAALEPLRAYLDALWSSALADFAAAARRQRRRTRS